MFLKVNYNWFLHYSNKMGRYYTRTRTRGNYGAASLSKALNCEHFSNILT